MDVSGNHFEGHLRNVLPLFGKLNIPTVTMDPLEELLFEAAIDENSVIHSQVCAPKVVSDEQFADQAMYVLDDQLTTLKDRLNRIKFLLGDLDDLLPRN